MSRSAQRLVRLSTPVTPQAVASLRAGDLVTIDGIVITGREAVYSKLSRDGIGLCEKVLRRTNVLIQAAPAGQHSDLGYRLSAIQATAGFRYAEMIGIPLDCLDIKVIIGKGGMDFEVYEREFLPRNAVYLVTLGSGLLSASYGKAVNRVLTVLWEDELPIAEACWVLDVYQFGPFMVDFDTEGRSYMEDAVQAVKPKLIELVEGFPEPWMKRDGEVVVPYDEINCPTTIDRIAATRNPKSSR